MSAVNYAAYLEIHSLAAAVIFTVIYAPLFAFFVLKAISRPTYVYFILALFCAIRFTAFILRSLLTSVTAVQESLGILIAYEILYNVGFFGLLYSAYSLVLDRAAFAKNQPNGIISRILRLRILFRLALMGAVAIGITGVIKATSSDATASSLSTGNTLREVAIYIFLVCAVLVFIQTIILARTEFSEKDGYGHSADGFGATHGIFVLMAISLLLVAREAFFTATAHNTTEQNKEAIWYPLAALTELLAVMLFTSPGLVPSRSEIPSDSV